jgi:spore germination protein YaaH
MSPMPWDEALIQYAIENMPASKVVLALPIYSHAWPKASIDDAVGINNDLSLYSGENNNTYSWQHDDISNIKTSSAYYNETENLWYGENHTFLKYSNTDLEMYYLSPAQVTKRLELAKAYGIKGLCYWRIGGDQL